MFMDITDKIILLNSTFTVKATCKQNGEACVKPVTAGHLY